MLASNKHMPSITKKQSKARARSRRYRERKHIERYGPDAPDQRGKHGVEKRSGSAHPRWNGERMTNVDGYSKVRVGRSHPLADPNGYAYEHLIIWVSAGNPRPGPGELLHHENDHKSDNRIENLALQTRAEHNRHHNLERGRDALGRFKKRRRAAR